MFRITKLRETSQLIHWEALNSGVNVTFFVNFVYVMNNSLERLVLWDDLRVSSIGRTEAWITLGDFNNVLNLY